jgi:protein-tyrosine phosphatase
MIIGSGIPGGEVRPGLWISAHPGKMNQLWPRNFKTLEEFDVIVNASRTPTIDEVPEGKTLLHLPMIDNDDDVIDKTAVKTAIDAIIKNIEDGKTVLVHCDEGLTRSGLLCAAAMMKLDGVDASKATLAVWLARRPEAHFNLSFIHRLEDLISE